MRNIRYFSMLLFMLICVRVFGQPIDVVKIYQCPFITHAIEIDGHASEIAWKLAPWTDDFVDIEGALKPEPELLTRMKMLWDESALYIFAELYEPHIWATLTERDQIIFQDNDFEVFIDPDGDNHNYFELEVNAFATLFDLYMNRPYNAGGKALIGFDISGLQAEVSMQGTLNNPNDIDEKWCVEIAIPWKSLIVFAPANRPPKAGESWRMNFSRVEWETKVVNDKYTKLLNPNTGKPIPENNWVWSPQGVVNMHQPEKWGYVVFSKQIIIDSISIETIDPSYREKKVLIDMYEQQKIFYKHHAHFAKSLYELNKQSRSQGTDGFIESNGKQFLISLKTDFGKTVFIDHQKRVWVE